VNDLEALQDPFRDVVVDFPDVNLTSALSSSFRRSQFDIGEFIDPFRDVNLTSALSSILSAMSI